MERHVNPGWAGHPDGFLQVNPGWAGHPDGFLQVNPKSADKQQEKIRVIMFEGLQADALLVMKTLSATPRPLYCWKAKDLSFLYVLLVGGVKVVSS